MRAGTKFGMAILALAVGVLMVASGPAAASTARVLPTGNDGAVSSLSIHASTPTGCGGFNFVYYSVGWYNNTTYWGCTLHAKDWLGNNLPTNGWGLSFYGVFCSTACNSRITISDYGYAGDFYTLYVTDNASMTSDWAKVGSTPQVQTSSQLVAPGYDSHWTGSGTTYSSRSFVVYAPAGVEEYFGVVDSLMAVMSHRLDAPCGVTTATLLSSGCSATGISVGTGWSPAGFDIDFQEYP